MTVKDPKITITAPTLDDLVKLGQKFCEPNVRLKMGAAIRKPGEQWIMRLRTK